MSVTASPMNATLPNGRAMSREPFGLLIHVFGDPGVAEILSGDRLIELWLEAERALALAEAEAGLIQASDADAVAKAATLADIDRAVLWEKIRLVGYPILHLVRMIAASLLEGPNGRVHFGATTQDIMDTGLALQLVRVLERLDDLVVELGDELARLVGQHRGTAMAARTRGQQAVPATFGAKLASFLGEFARHRERLAGTRGRAAIVSLYGAGGTSAALGGDAARVRPAFARRLGLKARRTSWHAARDSMGEFRMLCALHAPEAKPNPFRSGPRNVDRRFRAGGRRRKGIGRAARARCRRVAGGMAAPPPSWRLSPPVPSNSTHVARHLSVHPETMRANMEAEGGRLLAEEFMIGLSGSMGREAAHDLVYDAAQSRAEDAIFWTAFGGSYQQSSQPCSRRWQHDLRPVPRRGGTDV